MANHSPTNHDNPRGITARKPPANSDASEDAPISDQDESAATAAASPDVRMGGDIGFDRVVGPDEAGLGGGLDQAEEAQLGVTDEELAEMARRRSRSK
jgi:hypothetical protein